VLRLYDPVEADRTYHTGDRALLLVLDEGDSELVNTTMEMVAEVCRDAHHEDPQHVAHWLERRNDVAALEALISRGYVVDTMEVVGRWRDLPAIYTNTAAALSGVEGTIAASAHQSHSYTDGGCLYFTFAAKVEADDRDRYYRQAWDAGTRAVLAAGGALSHHHGVGLNRSRFVAEALGPAFDVLVATKSALDPNGILNPGKLGLPSPFGPPAY
jgi:alkyldihydroxyacetonephosphate synthase